MNVGQNHLATNGRECTRIQKLGPLIENTVRQATRKSKPQRAQRSEGTTKKQNPPRRHGDTETRRRSKPIFTTHSLRSVRAPDTKEHEESQNQSLPQRPR